MEHYNIVLEIIIILFIIGITIYALYLILSPNNRETITYYKKLKPLSTYSDDTHLDVYYQLFHDNLKTNKNIAVWSSACVLTTIIMIFIICVNRLVYVKKSISYYGCIYVIIFSILYLAFVWFSYVYMLAISEYNQELMTRIRHKTKSI
jgi:hypothetical protein